MEEENSDSQRKLCWVCLDHAGLPHSGEGLEEHSQSQGAWRGAALQMHLSISPKCCIFQILHIKPHAGAATAVLPQHFRMHVGCCAQIGLFNHSSWVDAVLIMFLFAPSGVSKESNAHLPLIGMCIRSFQNIYVSRDSIEGEKRKNGAESVSEKIAKRCAQEKPTQVLKADAWSAIARL